MITALLRSPLRRLLPLLALLMLAACSSSAPQPWRLTDISGHMPDLDFNLVDDGGRAVSGRDYRGKVVLLYFGYTHCPDVCPMTLAQLHVVMQRLGPLADDARILFVSVDPARDTPAVLHAYVNAFDPRAVGLTGSPRAIEALVKRYRSAFSREPPRSDGQYEVSHSSAIYIFDRDGKARLLATPAHPQDDLVHDLHLLLAAPGH
ncbi:SCO family protein [Aerosticca soli]|jgi:protein SCO1/2|uniref:Cytochrome oxidase biogenesis protein Sco1/SenC/PrrC, putative copper metallochaperone n=1 Tax=Aerosticca soli TaxID=2010829 RepID=A0A2Z6E3V3_9GAMM|nr:SCO family protein [Aerosticca soli]MDI3261891.1 SCO family protein [Fulvimonas sp.]BBD79647.1 cytochrome oxidase biogenesis protein Sco1/SenC/PrrC, putative copper metallochaperone [Aerosticca soli]